MIFSLGSIKTKPFPISEVVKLQKLFEESKDFFKLINGIDPAPGDAEHLLGYVPKGKDISDKQVLGIYHNKRLVGVFDLIRNHTEESAWFVSLLLITPTYRRRKIGSKLYQALAASLSEQGVKSIVISVPDNSVGSLKFWKTLGFVEEYRKIETTDGITINFIYARHRLY